MITHQIDNYGPLHGYSAEVSLYRSEYEKINKLLKIENFNDLTPDEYKELGIEEDSSKIIMLVDFEDGSNLIWRLCSGQTNYYDDVTFKHPNGDFEDLDCTYELDDIEIISGNNTYIVHINIKEDPDPRTFDERFWKPDEILWNILFKHRGHKVSIATYGEWNDPADMCLECENCNEVILDAEIYTICAREDAKE